MKRSKRLIVLLGVLVVVCIAAFAALRMEEKQEQIKTSGEVVLEIDADAVQSLSWENESGSLAFHRDGEWVYDGDDAFPVDEDKIGAMLDQFRAFAAAFTIEDVEDFGQYGLDDPVCTIHLETGDQSYEIKLGDFSAMDSQRYVSVGDGKVYLAQSDPLDQYGAALRDMIDNDDAPDLSQVSKIAFSGGENYEITYQEDSPDTYCEDDVYFTRQDGKNRPLDTDRVEDYLANIAGLNLTNYVTYNAAQEDLASYGLDDPELTAAIDYTCEDEDGNESSDTFTLHVSRDPEELAKAEAESKEDSAADDGADEEITAYARVEDSPIVYQISGPDYLELTAASYDDLRHREVLTADFGDVTQLDISLEGEEYTLTSEPDGDSRKWSYAGEELEDISALQTALEGLAADSFTAEKPSGKEEIALTVHLDNENFPAVRIELYRYDGESCLAVVDSEPVSLVPRAGVVDLMEAVNGIVLRHE